MKMRMKTLKKPRTVKSRIPHFGAVECSNTQNVTQAMAIPLASQSPGDSLPEARRT
jgi:hypothetical protein